LKDQTSVTSLEGHNKTCFLFTELLEGGEVALERILFVLPNIVTTFGLYLVRPLRSKFRKIRQWTEKIKDAVGRFFQNLPEKTKIH